MDPLSGRSSQGTCSTGSCRISSAVKSLTPPSQNTPRRRKAAATQPKLFFFHARPDAGGRVEYRLVDAPAGAGPPGGSVLCCPHPRPPPPPLLPPNKALYFTAVRTLSRRRSFVAR